MSTKQSRQVVQWRVDRSWDGCDADARWTTYVTTGSETHARDVLENEAEQWRQRYTHAATRLVKVVIQDEIVEVRQ